MDGAGGLRAVVLSGKAEHMLPGIADSSVDAVICDPPYGLAEHKPEVIAKALAAWLAGDRMHVPDGRGFMSMAWDKFVPPPGIWDECFRVLKPGGHMAVFAGTRTQDLMGLSIRLAGFEIRDSLHWITGEGFPKNRSTQLKPAHEPIILARKPFRGSMAANVQEHGTGAMNLAACTVGRAPGDRTEYGGNGDEPSAASYGVITGQRARVAYKPGTGGRWAPNLLLTHTADCQPAGTRKVKPSNGSGRASAKSGGIGGGMFGDGTPDLIGGAHVDSDGTETVQAWSCAPGCPVAGLDAQSGISSEKARVLNRNGKRQMDGWGLTAESKGIVHGDTGGASRFFPQFAWDPEYDLPFLTSECVLYGMLTGCERVNGAVTRSLAGDLHPGSAASDVRAFQPRPDEARPESLMSSALTADSSSVTTQATAGGTVPADATAKSGVQSALLALYAESLCGSCATAIAQSVAAMQHGHSVTQALGLPSTGDFSEQILNHSLALFAEDLVKSGTILTTAGSMTSLGCAVDAISMYITRVSRPGASESVPEFMKYQAKAAKRERPVAGGVKPHPTVKPLALMRWLVRLLCPPDGMILDPFTGTAPVVQAALLEGFRCIAMDSWPDAIAHARVRLAAYTETGEVVFG